MKKLTLVLALCIMSGPAFATCKSDAADKKLAGAALKSFMTKCERDATTTCETDFKGQEARWRREDQPHEEMRGRRRRHIVWRI